MTRTTPAETVQSTRSVASRTHAAHARWYAALAGVLGAGTALGVGELFSGFSRSIPSLVLAVGDVFVDNTPGDATETAIRTFGTNDKPILLTGIVVVSLLVGAVIGVKGIVHRRSVAISFAAFCLIGVWAAARVPGSSTAWSWISAIVSATAGALVVVGLLRVLDHGAERQKLGAERQKLGAERQKLGAERQKLGAERQKPRAGAATVARPLSPSTRRAFLTYSGGAAVVALTATGTGRALRRGRSVAGARAEIAARGIDVVGSPADAAVASLDNLDALPGLSRYVTPLEGDGRFYRIDTALEVPQVDPTTWRLEVGGLVDNPYSLSYDDILAMPQEEHVITLACVSNEVGGNLVGNAVWGGVPLRTLLERAGIQPKGAQIVGRSVDDFTAGFPTELALDGRHAMLAVSMNGQPLPTRHGFPARLVVPGLYGYVSAVKWLKEIRLAPADYDGYWVPRGWSKLGPMKTASRIDVPRDRARVAPGKVAIAGVAWAPIRGVAAVEVRIDGGPWQPARLGGAVGDETWLQWVYEWDATVGKHAVRVRATDKTGAVQSAKSVDPRPDGAEGLHEISVTVA